MSTVYGEITYLEYFRKAANFTQTDLARIVTEEMGEIYTQPIISAYEGRRATLSKHKGEVLYQFFIERFPDLIPEWFTPSLFTEVISI